ncbi:XRE family transcriptional regulator [Deltaproteobacteria bacterium Smac51]|nr:XRE family transcriptional regulator [Deltaproteobacteria bacterium Smac51]
MNVSGELTFRISDETGLEFVFSSGSRLDIACHVHLSTVTLTLVRAGQVNIKTAGGERSYGAGEVYLTAPCRRHSASYDCGYDLVSLCLRREFVESYPAAEIQKLCFEEIDRLKECGSLSADDAARLGQALRKTDFNRLFQLPASVSVARWLEEVESGSDSPAAQSSRFHFIRLFRRDTGLTPHQYLLRRRVKLARALLSDRLSIADVALETGFYDQSHLDRYFKKVVGLSPRDYIKSLHHF